MGKGLRNGKECVRLQKKVSICQVEVLAYVKQSPETKIMEVPCIFIFHCVIKAESP